MRILAPQPGDDWSIVDPIHDWGYDHLPPWARLQKDASAWWDLLNFHKCDQTSRYALYMLGGRDHLGWAFAADIMSRMQAHHYAEFRHASHWLHKAVSTAQSDISKIEQEDIDHRLGKGKGGYFKPVRE